MNRENFKRVLDTIKANPDSWNQKVWHTDCGTAHCFAGHAQLLAGHMRTSEHARNHAMDFLEITTPESDYLFDHMRTLADFESVFEDGFYGESGYDKDGFDRNGYDDEGYDRNGYDDEGYDTFGYDGDNLDRNGFDPSGYDCEGYDREDYDREGINSYGESRECES